MRNKMINYVEVNNDREVLLMVNGAGKKVVVGMSGGVDSSVAAYLLKEQGYDVIGVTIRLQDELEGELSETDSCCGVSAVDDARQVAKALSIPHIVMNYKAEFKKYVKDYFVDEYLNARTPNPCLMCNRYIKWEALYEQMEKLGADYMATGHYARIRILENGRYTLSLAESVNKDQTYVLYNLTQKQLSKTIMPVGEYSKDEVRLIAQRIGLQVANKPDSQDICFIPDNDYAGFIRKNTDVVIKEGNFVDSSGKVLGIHKGITNYTIGQRKGLNLALGYPVFVSKICPETNEVVVGSNESLFTDTLYCNRLNFMATDTLLGDTGVTAKIRYSHKGTKCVIRLVGEDRMLCTFEEPVRAVTPGQAVVFYKDDYVYAGGIIE